MIQVARNGVVLGSFEEEQFERGIAEGRFISSDHALMAGATEWVALHTLPAFQGRVPPNPTPPSGAEPAAPIKVARNGVVLGSFQEEQIEEGSAKGNFVASDDVLMPGAVEWVPMHTLAIFRGSPPPPPLPPVTAEPAPPRPKGYESFYRSSDNAVLSGVCAGLAHKFDQQPEIVRVVFVLAAFFWVGGIAYIAGSVLLPKLPTKSVR